MWLIMEFREDEKGNMCHAWSYVRIVSFVGLAVGRERFGEEV
jgi:hypothetical protein